MSPLLQARFDRGLRRLNGRLLLEGMSVPDRLSRVPSSPPAFQPLHPAAISHVRDAGS